MATLFVSETVFLTIAVVYVLGHPEFGWAEATARAALMVGAFNLLPVSPGSLVRGFYTLGVCIKERNFKDYRLALPVGFFKIIGYLAFPLQMAYRFPSWPGSWPATGPRRRSTWSRSSASAAPGSSTPSSTAFYNYPLSLGIRIRKRDELAAAKSPCWWAIPLAASIGAASTALVDLLFVRSAGRVPELKDVWWAVFLAPIVAGFLASSWSRRAKMGKRIIAGITAGALVGLGLRPRQRLPSALVPWLRCFICRGRRIRVDAHPLEDLRLRPPRHPRRLRRRDPSAAFLATPHGLWASLGDS